MKIYYQGRREYKRENWNGGIICGLTHVYVKLFAQTKLPSSSSKILILSSTHLFSYYSIFPFLEPLSPKKFFSNHLRIPYTYNNIIWSKQAKGKQQKLQFCPINTSALPSYKLTSIHPSLLVIVLVLVFLLRFDFLRFLLLSTYICCWSLRCAFHRQNPNQVCYYCSVFIYIYYVVVER